jgi:hypothetical protein
VISVYNYDGPPMDLTRHALNQWRSGFAMELATAAETTWESFVAQAQTQHLEESIVEGSLRSVRFRSGDDTMMLTYDPFRESIVRRTWNGSPEEEDHLTVIAGGETTGPFCPPTLFGSEVMI